MSRRTFTWFFREEMGVSFVTWRQQACLFACLPQLAAGEPGDRAWRSKPAMKACGLHHHVQAHARHLAARLPHQPQSGVRRLKQTGKGRDPGAVFLSHLGLGRGCGTHTGPQTGSASRTGDFERYWSSGSARAIPST